MLSNLQEWSVLVIVACMFMLTGINIYLVLQLVKGVKDENAHLNNLNTQYEAIKNGQESVQEVLDSAADKAIEEETLRELDAKLTEGLVQLEAFDNEAIDLISELQQAAPAEVAAWRENNDTRIELLLGEQRKMRARVSSLQNLLTEANATILGLRSRRHNAAADNAPDTGLVGELQQARRNSARLNSELNAATANVKMLAERLDGRERMLADNKERHHSEKTALQQQIGALGDQIKSMQDSIERTLVEKSFIEEAFLAIEERDKAG